jgi:hypothetical protein
MNLSMIPEQTDDYGIMLAVSCDRGPKGSKRFEDLVEFVRQRALAQSVDDHWEYAVTRLDQALEAIVTASSRRLIVVPTLLAATSPVAMAIKRLAKDLFDFFSKMISCVQGKTQLKVAVRLSLCFVRLPMEEVGLGVL